MENLNTGDNNLEHKKVVEVQTSFELNEFVKFLLEDFKLRQIKNPRYSMRAYAKFLNIDQSSLAKILKGKRSCGPRLSRKLYSVLNGSEDGFHFKFNFTKKENN